MMNDFSPANHLEEKLLAMYRKEIKITQFLDIMLDSNVAILTEQEVGSPGADFKPLTILSSLQFTVVAAFSSLERAEEAKSRYPGFLFATEVDTCELLRSIGENLGFALNPGWPMGFELSPDGLLQMMYRFGVKEYHVKY